MATHDHPATSQLLLADFQTVFTAMTMSQTAQYEAERSETMLMNDLAAMTSSNYLAPGALSSTTEQELTRNSLDAHIKKVQAQQIATLSANQINEIVAQAEATYIGRKILVTPNNLRDVPIDSVWFDQQYGYRTSQMKRAKRITGTIEEVLLDKNTLVIKPPRTMRLLNRALQHYLVYIIDPDSFQPMVQITLT